MYNYTILSTERLKPGNRLLTVVIQTTMINVSELERVVVSLKMYTYI